jgi:hypothetical protein
LDVFYKNNYNINIHSSFRHSTRTKKLQLSLINNEERLTRKYWRDKERRLVLKPNS